MCGEKENKTVRENKVSGTPETDADTGEELVSTTGLFAALDAVWGCESSAKIFHRVTEDSGETLLFRPRQFCTNTLVVEN